jgi:hypothetical protein
MDGFSRAGKLKKGDLIRNYASIAFLGKHIDLMNSGL